MVNPLYKLDSDRPLTVNLPEARTHEEWLIIFTVSLHIEANVIYNRKVAWECGVEHSILTPASLSSWMLQ